MDAGIFAETPLLPFIFTVIAAVFISWAYLKNKKDREYINDNIVKECEECGTRMDFRGRYWICRDCGRKVRL
jgi:ribosomal protein S14